MGKAPDFSALTKETIAKRAGYICSNPDCRSKTVGPNTEISKATLLGEAAHIYGARPKSKRYKEEMTISSRADITNAIWLCRNCHKLIDSDEKRYSSFTLFKWREIHDEYIFSSLGNNTDKINFEEVNQNLEEFLDYPPLIRRILIDKPDYWRYRLTSELLRFLNAPFFIKIRDLDDNLYIKRQKHISRDLAMDWFGRRISEAVNLADPIKNLLSRLTEEINYVDIENEKEIHHICKLIANYLDQVVLFEEEIRFTNFPIEFDTLKSLFTNNLGSNALKLEMIPSWLDELITVAEESTDEDEEIVRSNTISFDFPKNWNRDVDKELRKLKKYY